MDLYEYLISGTPEQAQIPALVEQLRKRQQFGALGQLTGDKVLAPFGQGLSRQTDQYAQQLQDTRQRDADNAQTKRYQDAQISHQEAVLRATLDRDRNNAENQRRRAEADMLRAQAALARANTTKPNTKPLTIQGINDLNDTRQQSNKITSLKDSFKTDYARMSLPGQRVLSNTLARIGIGGPEAKEAFEWWRQFQMDFNILARNQMFGATLSANEKASWDKAVAGEEMDANQIRTVLETMDRWYKKNLVDKAQLYSGSYNPEQVAKGAGLSLEDLGVGYGEPTQDDLEDFFLMYDENPELAVETWNSMFPDIQNPAERPAQ